MNAEDEVEQFERAFAGGHPRAETEEDILDFRFRIAESQIPPENDRALLATRQNNRNHGFTGFWGKTTGSPSNGAPPQAQDPYRARGAAAFFRCQGIEYQLVRFSASARLTYLHGTATALLRHYYGTVTALLPWASRCPREQCRSSAVAVPSECHRERREGQPLHNDKVGLYSAPLETQFGSQVVVPKSLTEQPPSFGVVLEEVWEAYCPVPECQNAYSGGDLVQS